MTTRTAGLPRGALRQAAGFGRIRAQRRHLPGNRIAPHRSARRQANKKWFLPARHSRERFGPWAGLTRRTAKSSGPPPRPAMRIPPPWQRTFDFFALPLVVEPSCAALSGDAGLLPIRQFDE